MKKNIANFISWGSVLIVLLSVFTLNPIIITIAIIIASIMDTFDGKMARKYGDGSEFSKIFGELTDSLCDLVNFGVAPSLILVLITFGTDILFIHILAIFIFIWAGIYRLARFSAVKTKDKVDFYYGVPITVAGPVLAGITVLALIINVYGLIIIATLVLAGLMVSKVKIKKI